MEDDNFISINDILDRNQQYYHNKDDGYLYKLNDKKKKIMYCGEIINPVILSNYDIS